MLRLIKNVILRPRVDVLVGEPIDARALVGNVDEPSSDAVRRAADLVMGELIGLVAELRELDPEHAVGVPRVEGATVEKR